MHWWDDELAYEGDGSERVRKYRRLQSRWREEELGIDPVTYLNRNKKTKTLGSLLPQDAPLGAQLLSQEAVAYTEERLPALAAEGRKAENNRLRRNMLSSQPMCFSIFGHLNAHREAGARVLNSVLPWPIEEITTILVEHAPAQASLRLGGTQPDQTAFDCMLELSSGGHPFLVGVETKYTEPFTRKRYMKDSYRQLTERPDSWFVSGTSDIAVEPATNQLWRNLLLAQESGRDLGAEAAVVVLTAADDAGASKAVERMVERLKEPAARLVHVLLEDLIAAARAEPSLRDWAERFDRRYLDLTRAEPQQSWPQPEGVPMGPWRNDRWVERELYRRRLDQQG